MVGDACFCDMLRYRASTIVELGLEHRVGATSGGHKIVDPGMLRSFLALALIGMIIPTICQTFFVAKLIKKASKKRWLDVERLTKHSTITVILICCTDPDAVMVTVKGSSWSPGSALAAVFGNSTGTPTVSSGAATIKMISNTSITSTKGVTLISAIGRDRPRPRPRRRPCASPC